MNAFDNSTIVAVSFIGSILIARLMVFAIWHFGGNALSSLKERRVAGVSIHHFSYGLALVLVAGYLAVTTRIDHWLIPCLFGAGLGLIVDEVYPVHLLLSKFWDKNDTKGKLYWGKTSYLFILVVGLLLVTLVFATR